MTAQNDPDLEAILKNKTADSAAALARLSIGTLPGVGPFLSELVTNVIPNQRIDRIAHYLKTLSEKLGKLHETSVRQQLANPGFSSLVEESIREASRSVTEERREQIASLVVNGLDPQRIEVLASQHLLSLLGELNDVEVLWLRFHAARGARDDQEFRMKHKEALQMPKPTYTSPQSEVDQRAIVDSYHDHLARLGLLRAVPKMRSTVKEERSAFGGSPKHIAAMEVVIDGRTGLPETSGFAVTALGDMLLRQIELTPGR